MVSHTAHQNLLFDVVARPAHYTGQYMPMDLVDVYDGSNPITGIVRAACDPPQAGAAANRTLYCLFDHTVDKYRLLGDNLECRGTCVSAL